LIEKDNKLEECHRKIEELHEKLKLLETENRMLLTQKSQEELERIQQKKQSMTLELKHTTSDVQTDTVELAGRTTETETCDTFHTANSDCSFASALPSPFPPRQEHAFSDEDLLEDDGKTVMSDSGVCLENNSNNHHHKVSSSDPPQQQPPTSSSSSSGILQHQQQQKTFRDGDNLSTNSSPHNNNGFYEEMLRSQMEKLREEIAIKKAEIMKSLEMGGEKGRLDEMINELQELQKDFVRMEMRMESSRGKIQLELKN
jgi:kinesin family member 16B